MWESRESALLAAFRRAASAVPAYRRLLADHGVEPAAIVDRRTFTALCPILTRANTFDGIDPLWADAVPGDVTAVIDDFGRHLCYETPRTLDVRRAALRDPELARELFGDCDVTPQVLEYDERRTLIEALDLDDQGYGRMTISMFEHTLPMPVLRYQTGYLVRLLDPSRVMLAMWRRGGELPGPLPSTLIALAGREQDEGRSCADDIPGQAVALA
jgi:hypothetical protein